jgi:hypothetical protein
MITSFTSGFPRRSTWTQPPESRVVEPRVVTLRRSTDAQTPIVPFFAARSAIGTCTANVWTP